MSTILCSFCKADGAAFLCGRCLEVYFCNIECQRAAWKLHRKSCRELHSLPDSDVEQLKLPALVRLMRDNSLTRPTAVTAGRALLKYCSTDTGVALMARVGGVDASLKVLLAHSSSEDVCTPAISCLAAMAKVGSVAVSYTARGIHATVATALRTHIESVCLAEAACATLCRMTDVGPSEKTIVAATMGFPLLIRVLDLHAHHAGTVQCSVSTLASLIAGHPERRRAAVEAGATLRILRCLKHFSVVADRDSFLACCILNALQCCTADVSLRQSEVIMNAGGVGVVLRVLGDASVADEASKAACVLSNIACGSDAAAPDIVGKGGIKVLVTVLRRHFRDNDVALYLAALIDGLGCVSEAASAEVVKEGGIAALIASLAQHKTGIANTVALTCGVLVRMSFNVACAAEMLAAGKTETIAQSVRVHFAKTSSTAVNAASRLLDRLAFLREVIPLPVASESCRRA